MEQTNTNRSINVPQLLYGHAHFCRQPPQHTDLTEHNNHKKKQHKVESNPFWEQSSGPTIYNWRRRKKITITLRIWESGLKLLIGTTPLKTECVHGNCYYLQNYVAVYLFLLFVRELVGW